MRRKNHRYLGGHLVASPLPPVTEFLGEGFYEKWMVVPGVDEFHCKRRAAFNTQRGTIESHAGARVLWSQANHDGAFIPSDFIALIVSAINGFQLRMPTYTGSFSSCREQIALLQGDLSQRRPTNQTIAMPHLLNYLGAGPAPAGDVAQEFRNIVHRIRTSVSQQQNCGLAPFQTPIRTPI